MIAAAYNAWQWLKGVVVSVGETLAPVFNWLSGIWEVTSSFMVSLIDILVSAFESFGEIVGGIISGVNDAFKFFGIDFEAIGSAIVTALGMVKDVCKTVFDFFLSMLTMAIKGWIALATMVERGLKFKFAGTMDEIHKRWDEFDKKISGKKEAREDAAAKNEKRKEDKAAAAKKPGDDKRFTPQQKIEKPELTGVIDLWRKAIQTQVDSPEAKLRAAQLEQAQKQTDLQERIADNTEKPEMVGSRR